MGELRIWVPEHFPAPDILDTYFDGSKYVAVLPKKNKRDRGAVKRKLPKGFKGFKSTQTKNIERLRADAQARPTKEIRLKDKEAVTVRFLEEPTKFHRFDEHYVQGDGGGFVPCIGAGCPLDGDTNSRATRRWIANVVDVGTGEVRLLKMTRGLVDTMILKYERSAGKKGEPSLQKRNYTITRLGSGASDTKYDVENEDSGPLEIAGKVVKLGKIKLIDVDEELNERIRRFFGGGTKATAKTRRGADEDDDDDDDVEDEDEEDDDEDEESDEEDEEEDEEDDEEDDDDEDDEDEDDDDVDDDEDDEDDDDEEEEKPRRKVVKKKLPKAKKKLPKAKSKKHR